MPTELTDALQEEYRNLFARITIRPERRPQVKAIYQKIHGADRLRRYYNVQDATGVPWYVVGIIHNLEASLRTDRHLHNGDRLTARTVRVPAGRPEGEPPFTWEQSALDALRLKGLHHWNDWSIPGIAFVLERFNGWGYRNQHPHVKSPYLWSFSNIYSSGKYVADRVFSDSAVSEQCGGMTMLKYMIEQGDLALPVHVVPADIDETRMFPRIEGVDGDDEESIDEEAPRPLVPYPGRMLVRGIENSSDLQAVQQKLKKLRYETGAIDGDFGEVTENAVKLFQARSFNAAGEELEVDGVIGRETWAALFGQASIDSVSTPFVAGSTLGTEVIRVAAGEIGVRERPVGSNSGPKVDQYIRATGLDPTRDSYPWCTCFIYWCFEEAARTLALNNPFPKTAGVHVAWNRCRERGGMGTITASQARQNPSLIKPGMVFFIDTGGGKGHAGIVAGVRDGVLETIEGNTNDNGSREGIGVFRRRSRKIRSISLGFAYVD